MNIVRVDEQINPEKYLIVTRQLNIDEVATTRVLVSEGLNTTANVIEISRGIQGLQGPAGRDGIIFDILPIMSGGTNNSTFVDNKIIYYDGNKLTSSNYSLSDIITGGVVAGTGIVTVNQDGNVTVNTNLGSGLYIENNKIVVDFDAIDDRILENITFTAGSGLSFDAQSSSYNVIGSDDILVNSNSVQLTPTGVPGTYTKITTDSKGRVTAGSNLTSNEIESLLGYIPWRSNNDGENSGLDADKLDSYHASFFRNAANLTGVLDKTILPIGNPDTVVTKIILGSNGAIQSATNLSFADITGILSYDPVNSSGDVLNGNFIINGSVFDTNGIKIKDNLPIFAGNHSSIAFNDLRGFRFLYGDSPIYPKTGIFGYDYGSNELKLIVDDDTYVILNNQIADTKYANLENNNIFSGTNTFKSTTSFNIVNVSGFNITSTSVIPNLNASFLESEDKDYFKNAANLTGILNPDNFIVTVTNMSGTNNYVPLFDDRTNNPSRTISDSIIYQKSGNLIEIKQGNLSVGNNNITDYNTSGSILAGYNNNISGEAIAFVFGQSNTVEENATNSFIAGKSGTVKHPNTVMFGQNGTSWSDNQIVYGLFEEESKNGQGQYSSIGLSYNGRASDYTKMTPSDIGIPQNKTILYDLDVVINRLGTSGVASFRFESGVLKNLNRVNPDNPAVEQNETVILKEPLKNTIFNNSYIRDYPVYIKSSGLNSSSQYCIFKVNEPEQFQKSIKLENVPKSIIATIKPKTLTATYEWQENIGNHPGINVINITCNKPITSGYFAQSSDSVAIDVYTYDHNAVSGSWINIEFDPTSNMISERYKVVNIIDEHTISVEKSRDTGIIESYTDNGDSYDILLSTNINDKYYTDITYLHVQYEIDNSYATTDNISNFTFYKNGSIITGILINGIDQAIFETIYSPSPTGQITFTALANRSGNCIVSPMSYKVVNGQYVVSDIYSGFSPQNSNKYKASKVFYKQHASDSDGYSLIEISGIHTSQSISYFPAEYTKWFGTNYQQDLIDLASNRFSNYAAVHLSNNRSVYCEFATYITTTYSGVVHNQVSGLSLGAIYRNLKGYSNIDQNEYMLPGNDNNNLYIDISPYCKIFIDEINDVNIGSYITTSGTIQDPTYIANTQIFIPYNYSNINSTGFITIIESGAYATGYHPKNINILPTNIHPEHTHFSGYIKYQYPSESGRAVSGYADIYATPIYVHENYDLFNYNQVVPEIAPGRNLSNETITIDGNKYIPSGSSLTNVSFPYIDKKLYFPEIYKGTDNTLISFDADHGYRYANANIYYSSDLTIPNEYSHIPVIFDNNIYFNNQIFDIHNISNNTIQLINHNLRNNSGNLAKYHRPNTLSAVYYDPDYFNKSVSVGTTGYLDSEKNIPFSGFIFNFASPCGDIDQKLDENYLIKIFRYSFPDINRDEILYSRGANTASYSLAKIYKQYYADNDSSVLSLENSGSGLAVPLSEDDLTALNMSNFVGETGLLFWCHYATGSCIIPQNTISSTINIACDNYGDRWGTSYKDGSPVESPLVMKYSASRYLPNCNSDQYCFEAYPSVSDTFSQGQSIYVSFDTPYENLNGEYIITKTDNFNYEYYIGTIKQKIFFTEKASVVESKIAAPPNNFCGFAQITPNHTQDSIMGLPPNSGNNFLTPYLHVFRQSSNDQINIDQNIVQTGLSLFNFFTNKYEYSIVSSITGSITGVGQYSVSHTPNSGEHTLIVKSPLFNDDNLIGLSNPNLILNSIYPIKIKNVSWKYLDPGDGWKPSGSHDYSSNQYDNIDTSLTAYTDVPIELHLQTEHGTITRDDVTDLLLAPRVNIFGMKNYSLASGNYDSTIKVWNLYIRCEPFLFDYDRTIKLTVEDYSGIDRKNVNLYLTPRLKIVNADTPIYTGTNQKLISIYNGGSIGSYDPILNCNNLLLNNNNNDFDNPIAEGDQIITLPTPTYTTDIDEAFKVLVNGNNSDLFFYTDCDNFSIPILIANDSNKIDQSNDTISIIAQGANVIISNVSVSNNAFLQKLVGKINFSVPEPGIYPISIQINSSSDGTIYQENHNIIVSPRLNIDTRSIEQPLVRDYKKQWSVYFYTDGVSGYAPSISFSNMPLHGYYALGDISNTYRFDQYETALSYKSGLKKYIVDVSGIKNINYDNYYARSGGIYDLEIYADDDHSFATGSLMLNMTNEPYVYNLSENVNTYFNQNGILKFNSNTNNIVIDNELSDIDQFTKKYIKKQDGNFDIKMITSTPIDYIYDANITLDNSFDSNDPSLGTTSLSVEVKGILNDQIYSVAKFDSLEVSSKGIKIPLEIKGLNTEYQFEAAGAWKLQFDVCYGIADLRYPPQVIVSGVPGGSCGLTRQCLNGFESPDWCETIYPAPACFKSRTFNVDSKCWTYVFEGVEDCQNFNKIFDVVITARDSIDDDQLFDIDQKTTRILFLNFPTPSPPSINIQKTSIGNIYPNCGLVSYSWNTKVVAGDECRSPTGLKQLYLYGDMPSGLSVDFTSISYMDGNSYTPNNQGYSIIQGNGVHDFGSGFHYIINLTDNNVSGLSGNITGVVTEFFNTSKVISGITTSLSLRDSVTNINIQTAYGFLNDPVRYGVVFFDSAKPKFLTKNQLNTDGIKGTLNPPDPEVFEKRSIFHENNGPYSGVYFTNNPLAGIVRISGINRQVGENLTPYLTGTNTIDYSNIYIKFLGSTNQNNILLSRLANYNQSNNTIDIYANINNVSLSNPEPCMFVIPDVVDDLFDQITANPPLTRQETNQILKCGYLLDEGNTTSIIGWVRPSYTANVYFTGVVKSYPYRSTSEGVSVEHFLDQNLSIEPIDGACCDYARNPIFYTNCYETGIVRLSGILLPKPVIESTDYFKLIYGDQTQDISIRISYGNSLTERNNQLNLRGPLNGFTTAPSCNILQLNQFSNIVNTLSVTSSTNGNSYDIDEQFFDLSLYSRGFVYGLNFIFGPSTTFPTTDMNAIPRIENTQYGIYKAHPQELAIFNELDRNKFPAYIPIIDDITYNSDIGITGVSGFVYGGFAGQSNYSTSNTNVILNNSALYTQYPPVISGFLSSGLYKSYNANYSLDEMNLNIIHLSGFFDVNTFSTQDDLALTFEDTTQDSFNDAKLPTLITGVSIQDIDTINNSIEILIDNVNNINKYESLTIQKIGSISDLSSNSIEFSLNNSSQLLSVNDLINIKPISGGIDSQLILGPSGYIKIININNSNYTCEIVPSNILDTYYTDSDYIVINKIINAPISIVLQNGNATEARFDMGINISSFANLGKEYNYHITTLDNNQYSPFIPGNSFWNQMNAGRTYPLYIVKNFEIFENPEGSSVTSVQSSYDSSIGKYVGAFYIAEGVRPLKNNVPYLERVDSCDFEYSIIYNDYLDMFVVYYSLSNTLDACIRVSNDAGQSVEVTIF
jgi:hypothetical protein